MHGRPPPPPPAPAVKAAPKPRATTRARVPGTPAAKPVARKWTPPDAFKPLILEVLDEAGGVLEADDLFLDLEIKAEDLLQPGDREKTPGGELRWQYAARRARQSLIDEGHMTKGEPGVWRLT